MSDLPTVTIAKQWPILLNFLKLVTLWLWAFVSDRHLYPCLMFVNKVFYHMSGWNTQRCCTRIRLQIYMLKLDRAWSVCQSGDLSVGQKVISKYPEKIFIMSILRTSVYPPSSIINIRSNGQFYDQRHYLFAAMFYPSLCLSAILLSPRNFPLTI
jgi:hypothetical protein